MKTSDKRSVRRMCSKCTGRELGISALNRQLVMTVLSFACYPYHFTGVQYLEVSENIFGTTEILPFGPRQLGTGRPSGVKEGDLSTVVEVRSSPPLMDSVSK